MRDEAGGPGVWPRVTAVPNREAPAVSNVRRVTCVGKTIARLYEPATVLFGSELRCQVPNPRAEVVHAIPLRAFWIDTLIGVMPVDGRVRQLS